MTVNISKPALNLREELAALRNQGGAYEESKFYIDYLVTNGTFDTDVSGWGIQNGASVGWYNDSGEGVSLVTTGAATYSGITRTITGLTVGKYYVLKADVKAGTYNTYQVRAGVSGVTSGAAVVVSTGWLQISTPFTATNTSHIIQVNTDHQSTTAGLTYYVDNISIYETDGTNAIHSTPHGYSIKDVYIDGVLAREGSAYDYTVHDGYIKPTIAPTATTETCLIGVRT